MTMLKKCVVASVVVSLVAASFFGLARAQGNGDLDQDRLQDGTCDNICDGTCPNGSATDDRPWRAGQQDRLNRQALAMGTLTADEITEVLYMRQEEKLARDVYITLYEQYLADVFDTIALSEQRHMDAIGRIIDAQGLVDPAADNTVGTFTDEVFIKLFAQLTEDGGVSYTEALRTGAYIEELDILDLAAGLEFVENQYLAKVLQNLMRGSRNHLRAFVSCLAAEGESYTPQLMTQEQFDAIVNSPVESGAGRNR